MASNPIDAIAAQRISAMCEHAAGVTLDDDFSFKCAMAALVISAPLTARGVATVGAGMAIAVREILESCPPAWIDNYRELVERLEGHASKVLGPTRKVMSS